MNIRKLLTETVRIAMSDAGIPSEYQPHVAPSKKQGFGDYQANGAMAAAKALKKPPREIAQMIVDNLNLTGIAEKIDIAGPGFINIHLSADWLSQQAANASRAPKLGIAQQEAPQNVVIDYSSPNLAKEMHVGHLRSAIIGDAIARVLEFTGENVIRQNHVGDWGTQFGMLIAELEENLSEGEQSNLALKDLEGFYRQAKKHFDDDPAFADKARQYVVDLQAGNPRSQVLWKQFIDVSLAHNREIYSRLNVTLSDEDVRGESFYNDDLAPTVKDLQDQGLVKEDAGAQVAFLEELADKNGNPSPVLVQKKDGGFLYATSDLAALKYRANTLEANRILYLIDDRQSLHMKQVFTLAGKAGYVSQWTSLEHLAFGKMLGNDGKPFKTRSGGTVKLADLLDEAIERAQQVIGQKNPTLAEDEAKEIAQKVGIGAVKYADLSKTRTNDYIFDWEAMLSFEGNTGPYMQYAFTRINSIFSKADIEQVSFSHAIDITHEDEKQLALKTLQFAEALDIVAQEGYPHTLCGYLYELASLFMRFYESCPILKDGIDEQTKLSRLALCKVVAQTLHTGLDLLGIETLKKM